MEHEAEEEYAPSDDGGRAMGGQHIFYNSNGVWKVRSMAIKSHQESVVRMICFSESEDGRVLGND